MSPTRQASVLIVLCRRYHGRYSIIIDTLLRACRDGNNLITLSLGPLIPRPRRLFRCREQDRSPRLDCHCYYLERWSYGSWYVTIPVTCICVISVRALTSRSTMPVSWDHSQLVYNTRTIGRPDVVPHDDGPNFHRPRPAQLCSILWRPGRTTLDCNRHISASRRE
jgi:hypothetical protein